MTSPLKGSDGKKRARKSGKLNLKGVSQVGPKFKAQIQYNGVLSYLGVFETAEAAARCYDKRAIQLMGLENAQTNFDYSPQEVSAMISNDDSLVGDPTLMYRDGKGSGMKSPGSGDGKTKYCGAWNHRRQDTGKKSSAGACLAMEHPVHHAAGGPQATTALMHGLASMRTVHTAAADVAGLSVRGGDNGYVGMHASHDATPSTSSSAVPASTPNRPHDSQLLSPSSSCASSSSSSVAATAVAAATAAATTMATSITASTVPSTGSGDHVRQDKPRQRMSDAAFTAFQMAHSMRMSLTTQLLEHFPQYASLIHEQVTILHEEHVAQVRAQQES